MNGPDRFLILRDALRRGAMVAGFCLVVALALGVARGGTTAHPDDSWPLQLVGAVLGGDWRLQLVYAEAIGLSIWANIEFGRHLFRLDPESRWPTGWRAVVLMLGGIGLGYVVGTWIGDRYCGCSTFELWRRSARAFASFLIVSIAVSAAISYFFLTRGKDQRRLRQIATAERDAADARLKLLESQLEPHMLFNTLANLRVLVATDPVRAQTMLDHLIAFLRATLDASRHAWHPLAAEFARVSDYLQLMQVRMGERLQFHLELPAPLAGLRVPPLLLQPLVENAIKHGLEPQVGGGRLVVSAEQVGTDVVLKVRDSGGGLSGAAVGSGTRFGLDQVRRRLATIYGIAASLELADAESGGTCATVRLPMAPSESVA